MSTDQQKTKFIGIEPVSSEDHIIDEHDNIDPPNSILESSELFIGNLPRPVHAPQRPWQGYRTGHLNQISPEDSKRALETIKEPDDFYRPEKTSPNKSVLASNTVQGPASIVELTRALKNDVDLIFEWVYNNIETHPIFGIQKGAFGALADGYGTSMDQCMLMIALLRQAGYTADYMVGQIKLNSAQVANWLNTDNSNYNIPVSLLQQSGYPLGYTQNPNGSLNQVWFTHCWVRVNIGGTLYAFDPSMKQYTYKTGLNLATATGYTQADFLTQTQVGSTVNANLVQNLNKANMNTKLATYSTNLLSYIKANAPGSTLDDVIGGRTINPITIPVRQTTIPNQDLTVTPTIFTTDLPTYYSCWFQISIPGLFGTLTLDSRDFVGKRLTLLWDSFNRPVLSLDGTVLITGSVAAANTWYTLTTTVQHNAYYPNVANNITVNSAVFSGLMYGINAEFGPTGRGSVEIHRKKLTENLASGIAANSENTFGETLAVNAYTWAAQKTSQTKLSDKINGTHTVMHHDVYLAQGSVAYVGGLMTVNHGTFSLNGNATNSIRSSLASHSLIAPIEAMAFQGVEDRPAVVAQTLIDLMNTGGLPNYDATSANWLASVKPNLINYPPSALTFIETNYINNGWRLIIPKDGNITVGQFGGYGFLGCIANSSFLGYIIDVKGVYSASDMTDDEMNQEARNNQRDPNSQDNPGEHYVKSEDPIDLFTGSFLYENTDISLGSAGYPYGLEFTRRYNSGLRTSNPVGLGFGWTHSLAMTADQNTDSFLAMGEDEPFAAVPSIVGLYVSRDLLLEPLTTSNVRLVLWCMVTQWWINQLTSNAVVVKAGDVNMTFIRMPDGTYSAPFGRAETLTKPSGLFKVTSPQGVVYNFNTAGKIATIVYPFGVTITFSYNGTSGLLETVTNGMGRTLTIGYTSGKLSSVSDGTGRSVSYSIDVSGNLTGFTDVRSKVTTHSYDIPGRMTQLFRPANPLSPLVQNVYDTLGRVKSQKNGLNQEWLFYFAGSRTEEVDPLGNKHVLYYNSQGMPVRDINAFGLEIKTEIDGWGRTKKVTKPEGDSVTYTYDLKNNVLSKTIAPKPGSPLANIVTGYTYDPLWNKVKTFTDGRTSTTTYTYNATTGTLTTIQFPLVGGLTPTRSYTYNARGQVLTETDETNIVTKYTYDAVTEKMLTKVLDFGVSPRLNLTTSFGYNTVGDVTSITDPRSNITTRTFDTARRLTQQVDPAPLSYVTNLGYDDNNQRTSVQKQTGNMVTPWETITTSYTLTGNVDTVTNASGDITNNDYDARDRLWKTFDAENRVTEYSYDVMSRLSTVKDNALVIAETRTYSNNGLVATVKDGNNRTTTYLYDGFDRLDRTTYPDATYEQQTYDANSNILTLRSRAGQVVSSTFDVLNRLSTRSPASLPVQTMTYDLAGRRTKVATPVVAGDPTSGDFQFFFDTAGRLYQQRMPDGKNVTYQLDAASNRTKLTYPDGYFVDYVFDQINRLTDLKLNGAATAAAHFDYSPLSLRKKLTFENGCTVDYGYELDEDLNSIVQTFVGASATFTYGYDKTHLVKSQSVSDSLFVWHPSAGGTTTYGAVNSLNQYPTVAGVAQTYNTNGCLTGDGVWTFGYDSLRRLNSAAKSGVSLSFLYDPLDRQGQKTVGATKTRYIYDGVQRIADYNGTSGALITRYIFGTGFDEPLIEVTTGGTKTYYHQDKLGSVVARSNLAGSVLSRYKYGPFGETPSLSGTTFGYTGQRFDSEMDLYYYKARYYSPALGRFLQPDPIGYLAGLNLYTYVNNQPLSYTDPTGLAKTGDGSTPPFDPSWVTPPWVTEGKGEWTTPSWVTDGKGAWSAPTWVSDGKGAWGTPSWVSDGKGAWGEPSWVSDGKGAWTAPIWVGGVTGLWMSPAVGEGVRLKGSINQSQPVKGSVTLKGPNGETIILLPQEPKMGEQWKPIQGITNDPSDVAPPPPPIKLNPGEGPFAAPPLH